MNNNKREKLHEQYFKVIKFLVDKKIADSKFDEETIPYQTQEIYKKMIEEYFGMDPKKILDSAGDSKDCFMNEDEKRSDLQKMVTLPNHITDPFMKKIKDDKDKATRQKIIKKLILELKEDDYAKFISYGIVDMMLQLQKFHEEKSKTIKDKPGPIFSYDDRYFLDCKHTREELHKLQEQILLIIKKGSSDIFQDVKRQTSINDKEIDVCLSQSFHYGLIERKRYVSDDDGDRGKFFKYFTK